MTSQFIIACAERGADVQGQISPSISKSTVAEVKQASTCPIEQKTEKLTNLLMKAELGWARPPPQWLQDTCPEAIEHFARFPNLRDVVECNGDPMPLFPTEHHARAVCTLKVLQKQVEALDIALLLHAGAQVGAIVHGQPIPWDDDIDVTVSLDEFVKMEGHLLKDSHGDAQCRVFHKDARLCARMNCNCLKIWVEHDGDDEAHFGQPEKRQWKSPLVDVFACASCQGKVVEFKRTKEALKAAMGEWIKNDGTPCIQRPLADFFPLAAHHFGGIAMLGPNEVVAKKRCNFNKCVSATWNHRLDIGQGELVSQHFGSGHLNCCELAKRFPFRQFSGVISNGSTQQGVDFTQLKAPGLLHSVRCGRHSALFCGKCGGERMCHGECRWDKSTAECVSKKRTLTSTRMEGFHAKSSENPFECKGIVQSSESVASCGNHESIGGCSKCGTSRTMCNGQCKWNSDSSVCVAK